MTIIQKRIAVLGDNDYDPRMETPLYNYFILMCKMGYRNFNIRFANDFDAFVLYSLFELRHTFTDLKISVVAHEGTPLPQGVEAIVADPKDIT